MLVRLTHKTTFLFRFTILFLFTTLGYGASLQWNNWRPVLAVTGGVASTNNASESQTLPVIDSSVYSYSADDSWHSHGIFGAFAGVEAPLSSIWAMQIGLAYYQTSYHPSASFSQGADAQSTDFYHYQYDVKLRQLLLEGKFLYTWCQMYHPYFSVGLGTSFNKAEDYNTDVPPFLTFTPAFGNHSTTSFTYNVGLGVDMDINNNWRFGLGYRFSDFGKVELGNGIIDTVPTDSRLSQSHFHVNELVAQLTFLID